MHACERPVLRERDTIQCKRIQVTDVREMIGETTEEDDRTNASEQTKFIKTDESKTSDQLLLNTERSMLTSGLS